MNDPIELEQFIQKHYTTICTIALKFVGSSDIAQDIAHQILIHAIRQLPTQSERIILLTLAGNNVKEIAEIIGVSVNTVRTLKYGAIRKLREYFIARNYRSEF